MAQKVAKTVVVLGAGISGLAAAYTLCKEGFNVHIIEKDNSVGGLARSFVYHEYSLDYGPHNFHTHIPWVTGFLKDELGVNLRKMPSRPAKIFFNGKIVDYPINIFNALRRVNMAVGMRCFIDFLRARILFKFKRKLKDESFEDWIENRFGKYIYGIFFGSYVEKLWGIPGYELDAVIAQKKIPEPSFLLLLLRALTGIKFGTKHSEDPHVIDSYYPIGGGIGIIADKFAQHISQCGGKIELNSSIDTIATSKDRGYIKYSVNGMHKEVKFDYLINTIPLNRFISYLTNTAENKSIPDSACFIYRGTIFLYFSLSKARISDHPWIYFNAFNNKDLIFNRMYDVANFTSMQVDDKKGVICLEITCYKDDTVWKKTDSELFDSCILFLEKNNFLNKSDVKEYFTKRVDVAYPVFRKGYLKHLNSILDYIGELGNVFTIGRQGLFSYTNIDHCIDMGLRLSKLIENGNLNKNKFLKIYGDYIGKGEMRIMRPRNAK